MEKCCYIYSLSENGIPFYIGKTINIKARYIKHTLDKRFPQVFSIDIIDTIKETEWEFWEKHYISLFKCWGFKLFNISEGGKIDFKITGKLRKRNTCNIPIYCKCWHCMNMFEVSNSKGRIREYCSDSCKKKAYYKRKKCHR